MTAVFVQARHRHGCPEVAAAGGQVRADCKPPPVVAPIHVFAEAQVQGFSPRMKSTHGHSGPYHLPTSRPHRVAPRMRLQPDLTPAGVTAC